MGQALEDLLLQLSFSTKEARVFLLLLELGTHPAATLAKKLCLPKSTVLFICNNLVQRGFLKKSMRGRTQFFYASPDDFAAATAKRLEKEREALDQAVPLLQTFQNPFNSEPRVTFYEGVDGCRKAYQQLLLSGTEILEFGIHKDLTEKLGRQFMSDFIRERVKRGIKLRALSNENGIDRSLLRRDRLDLRQQRAFSALFGETYSSIAIFDRKVLILNLHFNAFGILIDNREVSDTLRTIFTVMWNAVSKA